MSDELERLNRNADQVDARERRDFARRVAAARSLQARCAPYKAARDLEVLPAPVAVLGLSQLARRILALVAYFVSQGNAGLQIGLWDLVYRYTKSLSTVRRARDQLVAGGWLVVTEHYVHVSETKMLAPYVSTSGKFRSLRAEDPDDPEAHNQSQWKNLYTLGPKALELRLGERCGQVGGQTPDTPVEQATSGFLSAAVSGSDSGSAHPDGRRSCGFVDNSPGEENRRLGAFGAEHVSPPEDGRVSQPSAARVDETPSPPVAVETLALVDDDAGDARSIDGPTSESPRRGLFGAMGWRVSRFLRGGRS